MNELTQPIELTVCVITRDDVATVPLCLSSLTDVAVEILLVDCGSSDGTVRVAREFDATVIELTGATGKAMACQTAVTAARFDWLLYLQPDQWLTVDDQDKLRQRLSTGPATTYLAAEYRIDNPEDFFYRPTLFHRSDLPEYDPVLDEFRPDRHSFLAGVGIYRNNIDSYLRRVTERLSVIDERLRQVPENINYLYHKAFYHRELGQADHFQNAVLDGIRRMTTCPPEQVIAEPAAAGLFGYYADSLIKQGQYTPQMVESLVHLQQNLPADVRLNRPLAHLLRQSGRLDEARALLEEAVQLAFQPVCGTLTHYNNFIEPVVDLLDLVRTTGAEDDLINTLLNIQVLTQQHEFDGRSLFQFLNLHQPDFFNLIEGVMKRKIEQIGQ
ncbi:MAG: glycosyltransferase [Candidatus Neomarinimicrobiota bacterium]